MGEKAAEKERELDAQIQALRKRLQDTAQSDESLQGRLDAREKAYATLDSFTPAKRVWRTNIKRVSNEGPFNSRESIDTAYRRLLENITDRMTADLEAGGDFSMRTLQQKVDELSKAAEKNQASGEYDKAIGGWNEVLKLQPDSKKAKKGIENAEKAKLAAQEKAKGAELKKQIAETKSTAEAAAESGNLEGAVAEWKKILDLDKGNKEAAKNIESL